MAQTPTFGNRQNLFYIRADEPDMGNAGDLWFSSAANAWYEYDGANWVAIAGPARLVTPDDPGPNLTTELNGGAYQVQLTEDVTDWTAPIPTGGDASVNQFSCSLEVYAPAAGGPFIVTVPSGWMQLDGVASIILSAGDAPIVVDIKTMADGTIAYTAWQCVVVP